MTDLYNVLAILSSIPYIFVFAEREPFLKNYTIFFIAFCVISILVNKRGMHMIARHLLFLNSIAYIFITASSFGRVTGEQLIYLPVLFGAVLIYDFSEIKSLIFTILVTLAALTVLELTDYSLMTVYLSEAEQLEYYYGNIIITFVLSVVIALFYFIMYAKQNIRNEALIQNAQETEKIINYFATSLYGKNTVDEILWDIAKNCLAKLRFQDCVIYLINEETGNLEQRAAHGPKNPDAHEISNRIVIPLGQGIVGTVASTGRAEVVQDTTKDSRYIVDDKLRYSELAVPIIYQNKVVGVIDSEHEKKNFFTDNHLSLMTTIAALASNKIMKAVAEEEKMEAARQQMEAEKIKELDKVKSRFFNQISHEFRTPLTLILGPLDEMMRVEKDPERQIQLKLMHSNGRKLLQLINDLLEFSRLNEGILTIHDKPEDIHQLLHVSIANLEPVARQKGITFVHAIPKAPLMLMLDVAKVQIILANLLNNAIIAAAENSTIKICLGECDSKTEISIESEGPEIPAAELEKIFDRYYQPGDRAVQESEMFGMGLALSRELAVMHGGNVRFDREGDKNRLVLSIPRTPSTTTETLLTESEGRENATHRIDLDIQSKNPVVLIVEDSGPLRLFLRKILEDEFTLLEAVNGREGLKESMRHVPDLIISDIMMPEMDGFELCRKLKSTEMTSHIPVLLLTALADLNSRLEGLETGADYYLPKPFEPRELLTASNNLIQQRKKLREHFSKKIVLRSESLEKISADDRFLQKMIALIEKNIAEPEFKVEDLQKDLGISRMQLHRKLKALTDKSATEFVRAIRLKKAAEMLQRGQDNVSQVAYQVGFSSLSYFTKCFKEQFGVLPSAYPEKKVIR